MLVLCPSRIWLGPAKREGKAGAPGLGSFCMEGRIGLHGEAKQVLAQLLNAIPASPDRFLGAVKVSGETPLITSSGVSTVQSQPLS